MKNKNYIFNSIAIILLAISIIFNCLTIHKLSNRIDNIENKIVETKGVKRAFENAPEKEISLPGFNKEFKLFFNFTTALEIKDFMVYLTDYEYSIPEGGQTLLFSGVMENPIEPGNLINLYMSIGRFTIGSNTGIEFFLTAIFGDAIEALLNFKYIVVSDSFVLNFNDEDISSLSDTNNDFVNGAITFLNSEFFSLSTINSINSFSDIVVTDFLSNQDYIYGYDLIENGSPITSIINGISETAVGVLNILTSLFTSAVAIFYNNELEQLTFLGVCLIFVVAVPLAYWVINFIISLIKKIKTTKGK